MSLLIGFGIFLLGSVCVGLLFVFVIVVFGVWVWLIDLFIFFDGVVFFFVLFGVFVLLVFVLGEEIVGENELVFWEVLSKGGEFEVVR